MGASAASRGSQSAINHEAFDIIDSVSQSSWSEDSDDEQEMTVDRYHKSCKNGINMNLAEGGARPRAESQHYFSRSKNTYKFRDHKVVDRKRLLGYLTRIQNGNATPEQVQMVKTTESVQEFINPLYSRQWYLEELRKANWNVDLADHNIQKNQDAEKARRLEQEQRDKHHREQQIQQRE